MICFFSAPMAHIATGYVREAVFLIESQILCQLMLFIHKTFKQKTLEIGKKKNATMPCGSEITASDIETITPLLCRGDDGQSDARKKTVVLCIRAMDGTVISCDARSPLPRPCGRCAMSIFECTSCTNQDSESFDRPTLHIAVTSHIDMIDSDENV